MHKGSEHAMHSAHDMGKMHYMHLLLMTVLSFIAMYIFMYAMVDRFANVFANLNQFYMAGLMTSPMLLIELIVMRMMYPNTIWNAIIAVAGAIALVGFFLMIRYQVAVGDEEFLKSMIPHHAGAILMCEQASIQDAKIKELCQTIIQSQQAEIDQMKAMLAALQR